MGRSFWDRTNFSLLSECFMSIQSFEGTDSYIVSPELREAVNVAVSLQKPLLIKGEPGTGKTVLAEAIAEQLGLELITWHIKSTTRAQDGLYVYDTVQRLNDSRFGGDGVDVANVKNYIKYGPLGQALAADTRKILLEIGRASCRERGWIEMGAVWVTRRSEWSISTE